MNNYDIWADYGPASWDVPHRFVASYIYDMPLRVDGKARSGWAWLVCRVMRRSK